jgi:L-asparagine oxygenase
MEPLYVLSEAERREMCQILEKVDRNPYADYPAFSRSVADVAASGAVPGSFTEVCTRIRDDRRSGASSAHVLRNCPIDNFVPELNGDHPLEDKYEKKTTFIGEAFLELLAQLVETPLLAYASRFNGDFFIDVIAHKKYAGQQSGFSDGELVYHNDRTAHPVRADFTALLGMRCSDRDLIYTNFVEGRDLRAALTEAEQAVLRQPYFVTPFDPVSKDFNTALTTSGHHAILENEHSFRYRDTITTVADDSPEEAKDALIALKNALARAPKKRHRILTGDLFTFANQAGLHSRENIELHEPMGAPARWLLKTYAFTDAQTAGRHNGTWADDIRGRVGP